MTQEPIFAVERLEEIERSKRAEGLYYVNSVNNIDCNYSTKFSLQKLNTTTLQSAAKKQILSTSSDPQFPTLKTSKPSAALGIEIARAIQRNEKTLQNISQILIKNIQFQNEVIVKLSKEDEKILNELLDELSKKENASVIKNMLNVLTSSAAITMGCILLSPQAASIATLVTSSSKIWSYLLIISGVSNIITNEVLPKMGGFKKIASFFTSNESERKNLADNLQVITTLANTIIGISASVATSSLVKTILNLSDGLKFFNTALEFSSATASFSSEIYENSYQKLQSQQTLFDGKLSIEQTNLDRNFTSLHSALDIQNAFNRASINIFETLKKMQEQNLK